MAQHNELGKWGEEQAVAFLHQKGYTIRECDWKQGSRDIDIIALTHDEVTLPSEAVDLKKMRNIGFAADAYVKLHHIQEELRFDIISVVGTSDTTMQIEHLVDAFNPVLL